ncbi:unnamed protein product [Cochlearia groenlandica]
MALVVREDDDLMLVDEEANDLMLVDEEVEDRNDFHIEDLVEEFARIEQPVRHNKLPESDDEDDAPRREGGGERGV